MLAEQNTLRDAFHIALDMARDLGKDALGIVGYGIVELRDGDGRLARVVPFTNLITDAGDLYVAQKIIVGTGPASPSAPTVASGMKLGTGATAAAKNGGGSALGAYITGSNAAFDSGYAQYANLGAGLGVNSMFKTTWGAGVATNGAITEAVIVNDAGTNATSSAGNTYSRTVFAAIAKGASDTLAVTWNWKALGA